MKTYIKGFTPDPKKFGGSSVQIASLSDDVVSELQMTKALERFGKALIKQYGDRQFRDSGSQIVGVNLVAIEFTFITEPK